MNTTPGPDDAQECDVWWGGYAAATMVPSLLICFIVTGAIFWLGWALLERGYFQVVVLTLASLVWLVQCLRFFYRYFGTNYRITTRRLVQDWGVFHKKMETLFLRDVAGIDVEKSALEEMLGVGRIVIRPRDSSQPPMVWKGVRATGQVHQRLQSVLSVVQGRQESPPHVI